ncbi:MAG: hypothetical protein ACE5GK_10860 [Nitrospiria bacterium]
MILTLVVTGLLVFKQDLSVPTSEETVSNETEEKIRADRARARIEEKMSPEALAAEGKWVIFGTDRPELNTGGRLPLGQGQCAFCHLFVENQKTDRCPDLRGIEKRSHLRPKEPRYERFSKKYENDAEPKSSLKPNAKNGGEYIIESLYCPNCYVVEGYDVPGSGGQLSEMPIMTHMPWQLNDFQLVAVASYLQVMETPGDFSKVTAKQDWERYFNRTLTLPPPSTETPISAETIENTALVSDPIEVIVEKMRCFVCHKIPTLAIANTGLIGPALTLKSTGPLRLASAEYQQAVKEGRAGATTPREYILESILNPGAFLVPEFTDNMPKDYKGKFTVGALNKLADFLMTLDESMMEDTDADALLEES